MMDGDGWRWMEMDGLIDSGEQTPFTARFARRDEECQSYACPATPCRRKERRNEGKETSHAAEEKE